MSDIRQPVTQMNAYLMKRFLARIGMRSIDRNECIKIIREEGEAINYYDREDSWIGHTYVKLTECLIIQLLHDRLLMTCEKGNKIRRRYTPL